jgi:hypothetical protein
MINIVNLEREPENNGILVAHWTATKTDGDYEAKTYGTKSFTPDPESEGFVAYEDLTESDVVGWFTEEETAQIESVLDADLEAQAQPQVISGLPW